jgi:hypothetical protein
MNLMKQAETEIKTFSLPVERRLLFKDECLREARRILSEKRIEHMTEKQIASELYFHTVIWHVCGFLNRWHIDLSRIQNHADPIDISDFGDSLFRRFCFRLLWSLPGYHNPKSL